MTFLICIWRTHSGVCAGGLSWWKKNTKQVFSVANCWALFLKLSSRKLSYSTHPLISKILSYHFTWRVFGRGKLLPMAWLLVRFTVVIVTSVFLACDDVENISELFFLKTKHALTRPFFCPAVIGITNLATIPKS